MAAVMQHASAYLERFSSLQAGRDSEPNWLRERRELAMERFLRMGVPTPRDEEYKYTDLRSLSDGRLCPAFYNFEAATAIIRRECNCSDLR